VWFGCVKTELEAEKIKKKDATSLQSRLDHYECQVAAMRVDWHSEN
jgi:hypothetical protein